MVKANGMCRGLYPLLAQHPSREAGLGSSTIGVPRCKMS